jgi:hypothetical protein
MFDGGSWIDWTFSRQLVDEGLTWLVGEADVQLYPVPDQDWVEVRLASPSGRILLRLPKSQVRTFLQRTYAAVPEDMEELVVTMIIDGELPTLLATS